MCVCVCVRARAQSESSMDDDAMMAVDEALGQVFKTRFALKHQKKQQMGECVCVCVWSPVHSHWNGLLLAR